MKTYHSCVLGTKTSNYLEVKFCSSCVAGGYVDIIDKDSASPAEDLSAGGNLASASLFQEMAKKVADTPGLAEKVNAVFLWNINQNKAQAAQWSKFFISV